MQKQQAEYLQAMGVDLYVHRHSAVVADEIGLVQEEELVQNEALEQSFAPEPVEAPESKIEVASEAIQPSSDQVELDRRSVQQKAAMEKVVGVEVAIDEPQKPAGLKSVPLNFLWQQQGRYLFLSAQEGQPNQQESKLLDAIVRSISPSAYSESGEGKWPLTESQPTTETEIREFLNSFVQGRSELCGTEVVLVLFGEKSQKQFTELEGDFEDLLGKVIENEGKVCEFRVVHSLQTMLEEPQSKVLTWQAIRDLRPSVKSA